MKILWIEHKKSIFFGDGSGQVCHKPYDFILHSIHKITQIDRIYNIYTSRLIVIFNEEKTRTTHTHKEQEYISNEVQGWKRNTNPQITLEHECSGQRIWKVAWDSHTLIHSHTPIQYHTTYPHHSYPFQSSPFLPTSSARMEEKHQSIDHSRALMLWLEDLEGCVGFTHTDSQPHTDSHVYHTTYPHHIPTPSARMEEKHQSIDHSRA